LPLTCHAGMTQTASYLYKTAQYRTLKKTRPGDMQVNLEAGLEA